MQPLATPPDGSQELVEIRLEGRQDAVGPVLDLEPGLACLAAGLVDDVLRLPLRQLHDLRLGGLSRRLLPGMFANVKIAVPNPRGMVRIPAIALIVRGDGPQVAQVVNDTVHLVPIGLGRDFGTSLEVLRGIEPGAAIVVNPPESLVAGMQVKAIARGATRK